MDYTIERRILAEQPTAVIREIVNVREIPAFLSQVYREVFTYLSRIKVSPAGAPFARFVTLDGKFEIEAGVAVAQPVAPSGRVEAGVLPGGPAAVTVHHGPYETIAPAHQVLADWVRDHGGTPAGPCWELYMSDPATAPDDIRTEVVLPFSE